MNATAINGDEWTGEQDGDWFMYADKDGNLYESRETPAYRVDMSAFTQAMVGNRLVIVPASNDFKTR